MIKEHEYIERLMKTKFRISFHLDFLDLGTLGHWLVEMKLRISFHFLFYWIFLHRGTLIDWRKANLDFLFIFFFIKFFCIAGHWDIDRLVEMRLRISFYFLFYWVFLNHGTLGHWSIGWNEIWNFLPFTFDSYFRTFFSWQGHGEILWLIVFFW